MPLPELSPEQRAAALEKAAAVGKARAAKIMERLEISPTRRVRGLGANQRRALESEFGGENVQAEQVPEGAV